MAKNYSQDKSASSFSKTLPSSIVVKRILTFSRTYKKTKESKKHIDKVNN
tara:strand:- start:266 stop:415 length:150 start_codon:yes stop_codon:yes gene_type:complete